MAEANTDHVLKLAQAMLYLGGILTAVGIGSQIGKIVTALQGLAAFIEGHAVAFGVGSVLGGIAATVHDWKAMTEARERTFADLTSRGTRRALFSGRLTVADLRKQGMTDQQIRELIEGKREEGDRFANPGPLLQTGPSLEDLKLAGEIRKRQAENVLFFRERATAAGAAGRTGYAKDVEEINAQIGRRTSFVDEFGREHRVPLTKEAVAAIFDEARKRYAAYVKDVQAENRKLIGEYLKDMEEANSRLMAYEAGRLQQRLQNEEEIAAKNLEHVRQVYAFEEQRAGFAREAQLRQVEGGDAQTLRQKIAVEQQKAAIEIEYLEKVHEVRTRLFDLDTSRMVMEEELNLQRLGYRAEAIRQRIGELAQQREEIRQQMQETTDAGIQAARETAANRSAELVRDRNRQIFESLKQQAGGVFDALLERSQSVWAAMANSLKTAVLTALKEIVTSRIAVLLMQLFTGQKAALAPRRRGAEAWRAWGRRWESGPCPCSPGRPAAAGTPSSFRR